MSITGQVKSFDKKFKFQVEIDGFASAGFQKCSELSVEIAKVEQWEGGAIVPNKSPGRLTFADVTLERGATRDRDMWIWLSTVAQMALAGVGSLAVGLPDPAYKRHLDIVQYDRDKTVLKRWSLFSAWPVKFVAGEWDNTADENVIESVTLTFDFFERTF
jgi:phage tail-like protein